MAFPTDDERGSEVDDYTGEIPVVDPADGGREPDGPQPSGFGDGDVADVDDDTGEVPASDVAIAPDPADYTSDDLAALIAERDQFKDAAIRLQAEFENFRKRSSSQLNAQVDRATGQLAEAFLPVLDAAESAYVQYPDQVGPLFSQMLTELKRLGLEALDLESKPFDPAVAEAVAHQPGDGGETTVAEVLRSGYSWKGHTLRPAMVRTTD